MASTYPSLPPTELQRVHQPAMASDMDADSAALIAQLALEDLEEAFNAGKGKSHTDAPLSDAEYAYKLQFESFQELLATSEDEKYARSLARALNTDVAYLEAAIAAEEAAAQDRQAAEMLSRGLELPPPTPVQTLMENPAFVMHPEPAAVDPNLKITVQLEATPDSEMVDTLNKLRPNGQTLPEILKGKGKVLKWAPIDKGDTDSLEEYLDWNQNTLMLADILKGQFTSSLAAGPSVDRNKKVQCTICNDTLSYNKALHTPCDHNYCGECVTNLVQSFTRDESLFPLRCCQKPIPIADVDSFISSALRALFLEKHAEFSVLSKDRLYCFEPTCSTFLGSTEGIDATGVICPACAHSTCPRCKQAEHTGEDCVVNAATIAVRALAREQGWQICPQCHTLVELSIGCYHMTCRCQAQFCYLCAVPWKNCQCPQWEEGRLLETAQQRVENLLGARAVRTIAPDVMVQQVRRMAQDLRENHNCERHVWMYRNGGGTCEECHHRLDKFLKICKNCSLLACVRCTQNRL